MDAALVSCLMIALVGAERDTTLRSNPNFLVCTPSAELAGELLTAADILRDELAEEWLDEKLPPGAGKTHIHLQLSDAKDEGWMWPIDHADRRAHHVWLVTDREKGLGCTLAHELSHVVLVTRYPGQIPAWANEGAACQRDEERSRATRRRIVESFARSGRWPQLTKLLRAQNISSHDQTSYAAAVSLTDFLIERRDKPTLIRFAVAGQRGGWDAALREHYQIKNVAALQSAWQRWTRRPASLASAIGRSSPSSQGSRR